MLFASKLVCDAVCDAVRDARTVDVKDIVSISGRVLLRSDGLIYELDRNYILNSQLSTPIRLVDSTECLIDGLYIGLITRSGQILQKKITEMDEGRIFSNDNKYESVKLANTVKAIAISVGGEITTAILDNGRVVQGENIMTTIPRLNVYRRHTSRV